MTALQKLGMSQTWQVLVQRPEELASEKDEERRKLAFGSNQWDFTCVQFYQSFGAPFVLRHSRLYTALPRVAEQWRLQWPVLYFPGKIRGPFSGCKCVSL